jgi:large exoprotein involved in heme utilization and adhesion
MIDASLILADTQGDMDGAEIGIDIEIDKTFVLTNGGFLTTDVFGAGDAGDIRISANDMEVSGGAILGSQVFTDNAGNAGNVTITAERVQILEGARISSSTSGTGHGGAMTIRATGGIVITGHDQGGDPSALISNAFGGGDHAGDAGNLFISAPILEMAGGRITSRTEGDGDAGNIDIQVDRLTVTEGGQIFSGTGDLTLIDGELVFTGTGGPGRGGNVSVMAHEFVTISGRDSAGFDSGLFSNAQFGTGGAGDIHVITPRLAMQGGLILSSSQRTSSGDAGSTTLEVGTLTLTEGAAIPGRHLTC